MQEKKSRRPNTVRSQEMKERLISVARDLFAKNGFAATGTPEIVRKANVTRGALYHHFADKTDLFRAVVLAEAVEVEREISNATGEERDPAASLKQGARAYFKAMRAPGRARLLLLDGPAVLGLVEMEKIDRKTGGGTLKQGLLALLPDQSAPIDALAQLLSAAFDRAAILVSADQNGAPFLQALDFVFDRLADDAGSR